ncbi:MAG: FAD-dependent monooxygenase, partial [Dehalococcoidia bacterium]
GLDSARDGARAAVGEGFDPAVVAAVRATAPEDARRDELYDLPAEGAWHDGRIALLGDAAHPMLPHAGQGAAQALEDAVVLGRCLAEDGSVVEALARYEAVRRPRAARIVRLARRNAQLGSVDAAVACALRDLAMRLLPTPLLLRQLLSVNRVDLEG